jgi:hypothetical protein
LLERELACAQPFGLQVLARDLILTLRAVHADASARDHAQPSCGLNFRSRSADPNMTPLIWAPRSLSVKYMWPDVHTLQLDSSPSTHTSKNCSSSSVRILAVSSETVRMRRGCGSGCAVGGVSSASAGILPPATEIGQVEERTHVVGEERRGISSLRRLELRQSCSE